MYKKQRDCIDNINNKYTKIKYGIMTSYDEIYKNIIDDYTQPKHIYKMHKKYKKLCIKYCVQKLYVINKESLEHSLLYMYNKFKTGHFVRIRNNKLEKYIFFVNNDFINPYEIDISNIHNDVNLKLGHVDNSDIIVKDFCFVKFNNKNKKWLNNDFSINSWYHSILIFWLRKLIKNKISDIDFFLTINDHNILKNDLTEPYYHIVNDKNKILEKYKYSTYCPILSFCRADNYIDIPFIIPDDLSHIYKMYDYPKCVNPYNIKINKKWNTKKNIAVFRGAATGCYTGDNNLRIVLHKLSYKYPTILDAGITLSRYDYQGRKEYNKDINFAAYIMKEHLDKYPYKKEMPLSEQTNYKYIICVEGTVNAFRLGFLFKTRSLVLYVDEEFKPWYYPYLISFHNCIIIDRQYSNLIESINWCINNDTLAKKIMKNGYKLFKKHFTKKSHMLYSKTLFNTMANYLYEK